MADVQLPLDRAGVAAKLKELCEENPTKVNPIDRIGSCLYTSHSDPDHHCIAGQVFADIGAPMLTEGEGVWTLTTYNVYGEDSEDDLLGEDSEDDLLGPADFVRAPHDRYITADGAKLLSAAQGYADGQKGEPRPWGEVYAKLIEEEEDVDA